MNLYIETKNNQPINHLGFEDNLLQAFGAIPEHWKPFTRVEIPILSGYQIYEGVTYELIGDVYTDVHHVTEMTDSPLTPDNKLQWATYRQELRDVTSQQTFPYDIIWPEV